MADFPKATTKIVSDASGFASGTDRLVVIGCAAMNADMVPRQFASTQDLLAKHGYSQAVDYAAMHFDQTQKPLQFVALPVAVAGSVSFDASGVAGAATVTVAASPNGVMEEMEGALVITRAGTAGTDYIEAELTLGVLGEKRKALVGKALSYALPHIGVTFSFTAGTLLEGDTITFATSAPKWSFTDFEEARKKLFAQLLPARSWLLIGDADEADITEMALQANIYADSNDRFVRVRCQARDIMGRVDMAGLPTLTFNAASPGEITRATGSWITDGFVPGMTINVTGSLPANTGDFYVTTVTASQLTLGSATVSDAAVANCEVYGRELQADWRTSIITDYAPVSNERRIDIGAGRGRVRSPITKLTMRRGVQWAASLREYQHDVQIASWRKSDGRLPGWSLSEGEALVEHDERVYGGLGDAGFTTLRTWGNDEGAFVSRSLTRALPDDPLINTHYMDVANLACSIAQANSELTIGDNLVLNDDGTGREEDLSALDLRVTSALEATLLSAGTEGPKASSVSWEASRTNDLSVASPSLDAVLTLVTLGTLVKINTVVRVNPRS